MIKHIKDIDLNYNTYGDSENKAIVLLHGWGQNIEMMDPVGKPLIDNFYVVIIDLPGFGLSSEPLYPWTIEDYVELLNTLLKELKIKKPTLIGHSFGGKISLLYASKYEVEKLILFGSPYYKEIQKLSLKTRILKTLKKVPLINKLQGFAKRHIGSTDYKKASPIMREVLVNSVNLDITNNVKNITCPTILIWGTKDEAVPITRAYELERLIPDAGLIVYENCTHYAYLERIDQTINIIKNFLGE